MTHTLLSKKSLSIIILIIISAGVYLNSLNNSFVWDDIDLIVNKSHVSFYENENIVTFFTSDFCSAIGDKEKCTFYRPIIVILHLLEYKLFGLNPMGYHLMSILFHILVVMSIYFTGLIVFQDNLVSLISALIFATHPVHVESISFAAALTDPPAAFFMLLSFITFSRYLSSNNTLLRKTNYSVSIILFLISILCKEMAITFPILLFLYEMMIFSNNGKRRFQVRYAIKYIPFILVIIIYLLIRLIVVNMSSEIEGMNLYYRLLNVPFIISGYIKLLFFPINLTTHRSIPIIITPFQKGFFVYFLFLIIIIILLKQLYNYSKIKLFLILWILITLSPVLNIIPIPYPRVTDRFLYIPSIGFHMFFGLVSGEMIRGNTFRPISKRIGVLLLLSTLILLSIGTIKRNFVWKDEITLFSDAIKKSPNSSTVYNNLGNAYYRQKRFDIAINLYKKALNINPNLEIIHYNLGNVYSDIGNLELAIKEYKETIRLNPLLYKAKVKLGNIYLKKGEIGMAERILKEALEDNPDYYDLYYVLGNLYVRQGNIEMAINNFKETVRQNPEDKESIYNLAVIYESLGRRELAIEYYKRFLEVASTKKKYSSYTKIAERHIQELIDKGL